MEERENQGLFCGVGIGPGDAQLLTKKAEQLILEADCVIVPGKDKESCRAYAIAKEAVPEIENKNCQFMPFPMSMKSDELQEFHREVANKVISMLKEGKQAVFLTIGDSTIYSTFVYVERLVKEAGYQTEYISGVPSFCAVAARLGIPLTIGEEELHVIPGKKSVDEALKLPGTLVFMKAGKNLAKLKERLVEEEKASRISVMAVSNCGYDNELIAYGAENISLESGYLTVVIVRREE